MQTRVSAYALAVHDGHVLLTQLADFCFRAGHWTFPGGGLDLGEQPHEALVREVHEETSLIAADVSLFHAMSFSEQTERGPFMAVQLIYRATVLGEPRVLEVGGSTVAAAWVPLTRVPHLPTVPMVGEVLRRWEAGG